MARWSVRHRRLVLVGTLLALALAGWRASKLKLKTDMVELLPQDAPAVATLRRMDARMDSLPTVIVVVESPAAEANRRFVDALVPVLRRLDDSHIADVEWGVAEQREFYRRNLYLYASLDDLHAAHERLQREILKRKNPAFIDLSDGESEEPAASLQKKTASLLARFPDDHFATSDGRVYAIVVRLRGSLLGHSGSEAVLASITDAVTAARPEAFHPAMHVGLTGNVVSGLAERQALEDDMKLATCVCTLLVGLAMFLFFRAPGPVLSSVVPAGCGVVLALGFAQLSFGFLNASTAFMGAIILGNGINYAIIQTARYEEERRRGASPASAAVLAVTLTSRATGVAALGAAVSYGALATTSFRGFSQFGYIGAAGMLISWLATLVVLPALWTVSDRRAAPHRLTGARAFSSATNWIADRVLATPKMLLGLGAVLTVVSAVALTRYAHDPFEYDFRRLGNQSAARAQAESLSRKVDPIFGRALSPGVVLLDDASDAPAVKQALRARDPERAVISKITTIDDLLPGDAATQAAKLDLLAKIRRLVDRNLGLLDGEQRARLQDLRPPDDLRPLSPPDLPLSLRRYFTERDGTVGRPVLYFPPTTVSVWDGRFLLRLAGVVESVRLEDGRTVRSSGSGVVFAAMLRAIVHDGPLVTAVAFVGVALVILVLSGWRRDTLVALAALTVGVLWMAGAAGVAGVRVNFLNFIALPITFGIGADYGINLVQRRRIEGPGGTRRTLVATGGAVTLCSLTTIIGYAALLCADSHALRSFGAMAILGEISCLAVSLVLMPAFFALLDQRTPAQLTGPDEQAQMRSAGGKS